MEARNYKLKKMSTAQFARLNNRRYLSAKVKMNRKYLFNFENENTKVQRQGTLKKEKHVAQHSNTTTDSNKQWTNYGHFF